MSLKNLLNTAKSKTGGKSGLTITDNDGMPTFLGLEYGITTKQPSQAELKTILSGILDTITANEQNGLEMTNKQKNEFLLTFYRLAFAQESRAVGCFHPSEISTETSLCHRKMYYQKGHVKKDLTYVPFTADNRMQRLCDLGTMKHLYIQENLDRLGLLIAMESPVEDEAIGISGKADGEIKFLGEDDLGKFYDEDMLLEVKTINDYAFKGLRKAKPEHLRQASIYGGVLKYKRICFLYYNKNTSEHKIFVHDVDYAYFDDFCITAKSIVDLYNKNKKASRSADVANHQNIPHRVCTSITTQRAMECAFRDYCFKH